MWDSRGALVDHLEENGYTVVSGGIKQNKRPKRLLTQPEESESYEEYRNFIKQLDEKIDALDDIKSRLTTDYYVCFDMNNTCSNRSELVNLIQHYYVPRSRGSGVQRPLDNGTRKDWKNWNMRTKGTGLCTLANKGQHSVIIWRLNETNLFTLKQESNRGLCKSCEKLEAKESTYCFQCAKEYLKEVARQSSPEF